MGLFVIKLEFGGVLVIRTAETLVILRMCGLEQGRVGVGEEQRSCPQQSLLPLSGCLLFL